MGELAFTRAGRQIEVATQDELDDLPPGGGGEGGGSAWTSVPVSTDLADWDVVEGTWVSVGGVISQTDEADGGAVLKTVAELWAPSAVIEFEVRIPSGQAGVDNSVFAAYTACSDAGLDGLGVSVLAQTAWPAPGTWNASMESNGGVAPEAGLDISPSIALDTWVKVRATFDTGLMLTVDDVVLAVLVPSLPAPGWVSTAPVTPRSFMLQASKAVDFRNLKLWVPSSLALPAGAAGAAVGLVHVTLPIAFDDANLTPQQFPITVVDSATKTFTIDGDHTDVLVAGAPMIVTGSSSNDFVYTVVSSAFGAGSTTVIVVEAVSDDTADGTLSAFGLVLYAPAAGDLLLDAWLECEVDWDTGMLDIGTFGGETSGLFAGTANGSTNMVNSPATDRGAGYTYNSVSTLAQSGGADIGRVPGRLDGTHALRVIVTSNGRLDGNPHGAAVGSSIMHALVIPA